MNAWYQESTSNFMVSKHLPVVKKNQNIDISGYVKDRESLQARVIIRVNSILNHIDSNGDFTEGSCMVERPERYRKHKCHPIPIPYWYQKKCEILITHT